MRDPRILKMLMRPTITLVLLALALALTAAAAALLSTQALGWSAASLRGRQRAPRLEQPARNRLPGRRHMHATLRGRNATKIEPWVRTRRVVRGGGV